MFTNFQKFENNLIDSQIDNQFGLIPDYCVPYEKRIVCFESYWSDNLLDNLTVKPFLRQLGRMVEENIEIIHRYVDCNLGLAYYIQCLKEQQIFPPVVYLAMHGKPGGRLESVLERIGPVELCDIFKDYGRNYPSTIIYFGSCEIFKGEEGKEFAEMFLKESGVRAIIGYSKEITFINSLLIDTLFLSRFFTTKDDPFKYLTSTYNWVLEDYRLASHCGFSIFINEDYKMTFE